MIGIGRFGGAQSRPGETLAVDLQDLSRRLFAAVNQLWTIETLTLCDGERYNGWRKVALATALRDGLAGVKRMRAFRKDQEDSRD